MDTLRHLRFDYSPVTGRRYAAISTGLGIALGATALAAAAVGTTMIASSKGSDTPSAPELPATPSVSETAEEQRRKLNQQRAAKSETILTGPLGDKSDADTKKTLLGA